MADTKITALAAISTIDVNPATSPIPIVDLLDNSMAASGTTKKVTVNQILGAGGTATLASATITGDLTVRTDKLAVRSTGVGIGTTSVLADLNIQNGSNCRCEVASQAGGTVIENLNNARNAYLNMTMYADAYIWNRLGSEVMRLNSTGLGVGASPANDKLLSLGSMGILLSGATSDFSFRNSGGTAIQRLRYTDATGALTIGSATGTAYPVELGGNTTTRAVTIDASSNVGIGVTPSAWATYKAVSVGGIGASVFGLGASQAGVAQGAFFNNGAGSGWAYSATSQVPTYYLQINGENIWNIAASGTAGAQITAWTPAMKLDASGNLILLSSNTPATLTTNGQLTVNATSNTNLRFSYRGSDGVTRVANITLA